MLGEVAGGKESAASDDSRDWYAAADAFVAGRWAV